MAGEGHFEDTILVEDLQFPCKEVCVEDICDKILSPYSPFSHESFPPTEIREKIIRLNEFKENFGEHWTCFKCGQPINSLNNTLYLVLLSVSKEGVSKFIRRIRNGDLSAYHLIPIFELQETFHSDEDTEEFPEIDDLLSEIGSVGTASQVIALSNLKKDNKSKKRIKEIRWNRKCEGSPSKLEGVIERGMNIFDPSNTSSQKINFELSKAFALLMALDPSIGKDLPRILSIMCGKRRITL